MLIKHYSSKATTRVVCTQGVHCNLEAQHYAKGQVQHKDSTNCTLREMLGAIFGPQGFTGKLFC